MTRPTVAVDLDGLLGKQVHGEWKGPTVFPDPIPGAVEFTKELAEVADIVIHTTRANAQIERQYGIQLIREWLDRHGFKYHEVWTGIGKPVARAYVDDRAVECEPQTNPRGPAVAFRDALDRVLFLLEVPRS